MSDFHRSSRELAGPRDWILDLFGTFVRDHGGWIAVADLLELLGAVGVVPASGRSAFSRMKRRDELQSISRGRRRGYSLTDAAEQWFEDGATRIMEGPPESDDDEWLLASFTVPEENRSARYRIRSRLQDLGFGQVSGGLMIAPANLLEEATNALVRADFTEYVALWKAEHLGFGDLRELVSTAWDLNAIRGVYEEYLAVAGEMADMTAPASDSDAFVRYLSNVNAWRDLAFLDPGIPLKYLPDGWPSGQARAVFSQLCVELRPAALRHFVRVVSDDDGRSGM